MRVSAKVQALLTANGPVTSLVPATKIKVEGDWQGVAAPYIIHGLVDFEPTNVHSGQTALRVCTYQVSAYALSHSGASTLAETIISAMNGYSDADVDRLVFKQMVNLGFDTDLKLAHIAVDFTIAGALTA